MSNKECRMMKEGILSIDKTDRARAIPDFDIGYSILDILLFAMNSQLVTRTPQPVYDRL
jgi:hypothetical protein